MAVVKLNCAKADSHERSTEDAPYSVKLCAGPAPGSEILILNTTQNLSPICSELKVQSPEDTIFHIADLTITFLDLSYTSFDIVSRY